MHCCLFPSQTSLYLVLGKRVYLDVCSRMSEIVIWWIMLMQGAQIQFFVLQQKEWNTYDFTICTYNDKVYYLQNECVTKYLCKIEFACQTNNQSKPMQSCANMIHIKLSIFIQYSISIFLEYQWYSFYLFYIRTCHF